MLSIRALVAAVVLLALAPPAAAQSSAEVKARALFKEGNKLLEAGNYVGALEMYEEAYAAWNNPKILLNIGTAQRSLGRNAAACETYERWLADPKADAQRKKEVQATLVELGKKVGWIEVVTTEDAAQILVDGKEIGTGSAQIRLDPGSHMVAAQVEGFELAAATVQLGAGETKKLALTLVKREVKPDEPATQPEVAIKTVEPVTTDEGEDEDGITRAAPRIGALLRGDAIVDSGSLYFGGAVGMSYNLGSQISVGGGVVFGGVFGAYLGGTYSLLEGNLHPFGELVLPVLFSEALSLGARGAAGVRYDLGKLGVVAEVGVEYYFSGTFSGDLYVVPSVGVVASF